MVEDSEDGSSIGQRNFFSLLPAFRMMAHPAFPAVIICISNARTLGIDSWPTGSWCFSNFSDNLVG